MVTADFELNRADDSGLRAAMIEAFRQRGIYPKAVGSLAVASLLLEPEDSSPDPMLANIVSKLLDFGVRQLDRNYSLLKFPAFPRRRPKRLQVPWIAQQNPLLLEPFGVDQVVTEQEEPEEILRTLATDLYDWTQRHKSLLGLDANLRVALQGYYPVHRIAPSGELLVEMVAQFVQTQQDSGEDLGGLKYRAGVTMIPNIEGQIRYLIHKPFHGDRKENLDEWVREFDSTNDNGWPSRRRDPNRITAAFSTRAMDRRRWR
jgi:hypothetical protein